MQHTSQSVLNLSDSRQNIFLTQLHVLVPILAARSLDGFAYIPFAAAFSTHLDLGLAVFVGSRQQFLHMNPVKTKVEADN